MPLWNVVAQADPIVDTFHTSGPSFGALMKRKAKTHDATHLVETHQIGAGLLRNVCVDCSFMSLQDSSEHFQVGKSGIPAWMNAVAEKLSMSIAS